MSLKKVLGFGLSLVVMMSSLNLTFASETSVYNEVGVVNDEVVSGEAIVDDDEILSDDFAATKTLSTYSERSYSDYAFIVDAWGSGGKGNVYYNDSGVITDADSNVIAINIPEEINGITIKKIGNNAFNNCTLLGSVTIPNTVENIGEYAFGYCYSLKSIEIPDTVVHIGEGAFSNCSSLNSVKLPKYISSIESATFHQCYDLTEIVIPENAKVIGDHAFNSTALENIVIPNNVKEIGEYAFYTRETIKSLVIPSSIEYIGEGAFKDCINLESLTTGQVGLDYKWNSHKLLENVELLNDVTIITEGAFSQCDSIISVTIPNSVINIGNSAFSDCSSLTSITIPDNVTSIGDDAFKGCSSLTSIAIPNSVINIGDSAFSYCSNLTSITIPNSVKSIGNGVFYYCRSLTSITIPNSVTSIGNYSFDSCSSLTSIIIPKGVTSIGYDAFKYCSSLTSIIIPDSVTSIGESTFYGCNNIAYLKTGQVGVNYGWKDKKKLKEVELTDSVTSITSYAFSGCTGLTSVTVPNGVKNIEDFAFSGCNGLTSIIMPESLISIGNSAFSGCSGLTSIIMPESLTSIGNSAFYNCSSLIDIEMHNSVTNIGASAFSGCISIANIKIPKSIIRIEDYVFNNCSSLTSTTIPEGVTSIGEGAFKYCSDLTSIIIPDSVTSIGENTFYGCNNIAYLKTGQAGVNYGWKDKQKLKEVELTDSVTNITSYAFSGCIGLTSVTVPNSVTNIGDFAFSGCNGLTSIIMPESITSIGNSAFYNCSSLIDIKIPNSVAKIGDSAFSGCNGLTSIIMPESLTSLGDSAFYKCNKLTSIAIPDNVTSIGTSVFYDCNITNLKTGQAGVNYGWKNISGLKEIELTGNVTGITSSAFYGCTGLTSITVPNSVTEISSKAFYNCSGLTEIMIPDSVTTIAGDAFAGCTNLTIYCPSGSYAETYAKDNNIPYSTSGYVEYNLTEADIPADVGDGIRFKQKIYEYDKDYFIVGDPPFTGNLRTMFKDESLVNQVTYTVTDKNVLDIVSKSNVGYVISLVDRMGYDYESNAKATLFKNDECIVTATLPNGDSSSCLVRVKCYDTGYDVNNDFTKPDFSTSVTCENNLSYSDGSFSKNSIPLTINYGNIARIDHNYTDEETNQCTVKNLNIKISLPAGLSFSSDRIDDKYKTIPIGDVNVGGGDTFSFDIYPTSYVSKQLKIDVDFEADNVNAENGATILVQSDEILNYNVPSSTQEYLNTLTTESQIAYLLNEYYNSISKYENAANTMLDKLKESDSNEAKKQLIYSDIKDEVISKLEVVLNAQLSTDEKEAVYRALYKFLSEAVDKQIIEGKINIKSSDVEIGANIVKQIRNSIRNEKMEYDITFTNDSKKECNYKITFTVTGVGNAFDSTDIKILDKKTGAKNIAGGFSSNASSVAEVMTGYVTNLQNMGIDVTNQGIISAVDFYGEALGINKYIKNSILKKLTDVAPILQNKGLGQIVSFAENVAGDYKLLKNLDVNSLSSSTSAINSILSKDFTADTIADKATQSAFNSVVSARNNLITAFTAYIYGGEVPDNAFTKILKQFNIKCPVDIIVYDSAGNEIGSVMDNVIECDSDIISISQNGDCKSISLLKDENISFKITATDYGNLNISVENYNDEGGAVGRTNYYDIPLTMDKEFTTNTTAEEDLILYSDSDTYTYNEKLTANTDCSVAVDAITENGKVIGLGTYVKGDYVALTAIPDEGYKFVGWYQSDTYLANTVLYEFAISSDITLTAKFLEDTSDVEDVIKGDINGDEKVTAVDAMLIAQLASGRRTDEVMYSKADINGDGKVTAVDAMLVARYASGRISDL